MLVRKAISFLSTVKYISSRLLRSLPSCVFAPHCPSLSCPVCMQYVIFVMQSLHWCTLCVQKQKAAVLKTEGERVKAEQERAAKAAERLEKAKAADDRRKLAA